MVKKLTRSKLIKKLDTIFSLYIRLRDCDSKGFVTCPLCGAKIHWKKAQNMHFITRACWLYRYDETNCHAGCMRCNVILNGNYIIYTRRMIGKYGLKKVDEMIQNKSKLHKITTPEIEAMIEYYKGKVEELVKKKHLVL